MQFVTHCIALYIKYLVSVSGIKPQNCSEYSIIRFSSDSLHK